MLRGLLKERALYVRASKRAETQDPLSGQLVLPESQLDLDAQSMAALKSCLERTEGMAAQLGGLQGSNSSDGPQSLCESLVGFTPDNQIDSKLSLSEKESRHLRGWRRPCVLR